MTDLCAIGERHHPEMASAAFPGWCALDRQPWPCDTAQVLEALDGLRTTVEAWPEDYATKAEFLAALADTGSAGDE